MSVWLRRLTWLVGVLLVLGLVSWIGVPALIKWQLPPKASAALGRPVTLGDASFNPWVMSLTLDDLAIGGPTPADPPLLKVKRVFTDLSLSSLFRLAPVIEALTIDAPQLHVARTAEGHYDIDDLIQRFTPKPEPDKKPSDPARFALYNVELRDGAISFDDRPVKRVHQIEALHLALPFLSNLPAQVEVKVEPHLGFKLNGAAFDSGAQATPFAQTRSGVLKLAITDLDLAPYLGYVPESLPVRIKQGRVSSDLSLSFAAPQSGTPKFSVQGSTSANGLALTDTAGAPLLEWQALKLGLRDLQPLARQLAFDTLHIEGLQLHAARDAAGKINLLGLAGAPGAAPPAATPSAASAGSAASAASAVAPAQGAGWQASLAALELVDARVLWNDAAVAPAAALQLDGLNIGAKQVQWPIARPIALTMSAALRTQTAGAPALAEFAADGPVTDHDAQVALKLKSLSLAGLAPYLAQSLVPKLEGQLAAQAHVDWSGAADAPRLKLVIDNATLDALKLREGSGPSAADAVAFKQLALGATEVDLLGRSVVLGSVKLMQPSAVVARDDKGQLNVQRWAVADTHKPHAAPPAAPASGAASSDWRVQVKDLLVDGGQVRFSDTLGGRAKKPVRVELGALRVALQGFEWHGDKSVAPANLQLSARVGAPSGTRAASRTSAGLVDYKGRIGVVPLLANGKLHIERFPVQLFAPYVADQVQLALLGAEAGYKGTVALRQLPGGLDVAAAGDVLLGDVHVATLPAASAAPGTNDELLSWQAFALNGLKFSMKPQARPQLEIADAALSDFYARLLVTEQGRLNLQDVTGAPAGAVAAPDAAASAAAPGAGASAPVAVAVAVAVAANPASAASAPAVADAAPLPIDIKVGGLKLINGRVDFTDHFIRPNYSAELTELNGQLGAFSSSSREMATLALKGRAAGTALLDISGQVNPTAKPLALDIKAKATDLELAPLSPYAGKYAGYAIERGKLSVDLAYKIDPDGKLEASNQVVLNQLTFGDKIESKDATKLPVLLAVALLKDRNGVIDINLPVSGSLNDPKFSIGGIIFKVIVNLLVKALTSPFALLSGGGSDDLSVVEFQPGTATLAPSGVAAIDKVAKALTERPALKMTVTGASDPVAERDAYQRAAIDARLAAAQRRESLRAGVPAAAASAASGPNAPPPPPPALAPAERTRLLTELYKDTKIPNKPRNAIGFAKDIPPAEMEALLKPQMPVNDDLMRELALQRGLAVRDALIAKGLPSERLFLAAPVLRAAAGDTSPWSPRVQLTLSTN